MYCVHENCTIIDGVCLIGNATLMVYALASFTYIELRSYKGVNAGEYTQGVIRYGFVRCDGALLDCMSHSSLVRYTKHYGPTTSNSIFFQAANSHLLLKYL